MKCRHTNNAFSIFLRFLAVIVMVIIVILSTQEIDDRIMFRQRLKSTIMILEDEQGIDNKTLFELNEKVYKPLGYRIKTPSLPIPKLELIHPSRCDKVFLNWLTANQKDQPDVPFDRIPGDLETEFRMNNYSAIEYKYINDRNSPYRERPDNWHRISELMKWSTERISGIGYGVEGMSIFYAMQKYRLDGQHGFIIGSLQPWLEIFALKNGAESILSFEFLPLQIQKMYRHRLFVVQPSVFAEPWNWKKVAGSFDFAASFSSINHSGLGRYGDAIDPIGDLREMLKAKCLLKKGGLFFLGLPTGRDTVVFNSHRIYGPIRFAMMMAGYELIDVFNGWHREPVDLTMGQRIFSHRQNTFVLRKL